MTIQAGTVLITGASSGIGAEFARLFVRDGHRVILVARRADRLQALANELGANELGADELGAAARVIVEDLSEPDSPARLFAATGPVDMLVNNAGFGLAGGFAALPLDRQLEMVRLNVSALTALSGLYLPGMLAARRGRILNVASTAAFQPGPGLAVYCATKAYVLSLSEALHAELVNSGVSVTCLCPGATGTEFGAVSGMSRSILFRHTMAADAVARLGYEAMMRGERTLVTGVMNRLKTIASQLAPRFLVLKMAKIALRT